jgi:GrpB-like predicted nucleotidyltransferase (UPF0157 family)
MRLPPLPGPFPLLTPERLAQRTVGTLPPALTSPIIIQDYDPDWPNQYAAEELRIHEALGSRALAIEHVGSTVVPGLPTKNRIDIDLIVADPAQEDDYVPALQRVGYTLKTREADLYEHRCLWTEGHSANVHVFGPDRDEHLRHVIFRDWLRTHPADRDHYAAEKRRVAAENPWSVGQYIDQKSAVVIDILRKAGLQER